MFFFLAVASMFAYALQNTLLSHHARQLDGFSVSFYRNTSLIITAIPLLFFVDWSREIAPNTLWLPIALAGIFGTGGLIFGFEAAKHLPLGIASAFGRPFRITTMGILGYIFLHETISMAEIGIMIIILFGAAGLSLHKNDFEHLEEAHLGTGFLFVILATVSGAISVLAITIASRNSDPFLTGYLWESSIAACLVILAGIRYVIWNKSIKKVTRKQLYKIILDSSPTVIGTGCYTFATTLGPLAILGAIGSSGTLFVALLGWMWFREKLRTIDIFWMVLIIGGVILLKFI